LNSGKKTGGENSAEGVCRRTCIKKGGMLLNGRAQPGFRGRRGSGGGLNIEVKKGCWGELKEKKRLWWLIFFGSCPVQEGEERGV